MSKMQDKENHNWLITFSRNQGISLFGVADVESMADHFLLSPDELRNMKYGIVLGLVLSPSVLDGIQNQPTLLYKWHYREANNLLDHTAFLLSKEIHEKGFRALPIPASQLVDWEKHRGHVSHRAVGEAAGLGWRGRNNLLVNPKYGSQFRMATILTDLPLETGIRLKNGCGPCRRCVQSCPASALGDSPEDYDFGKCYALLTQFSKSRGIGVHICGVCVKVCPGRQNG